jgi:hypothetical protein
MNLIMTWTLTELLHISRGLMLQFMKWYNVEKLRKNKRNEKSVKDIRSGWPIVKFQQNKGMCSMERREWNLKVEIKSNLYPNTFISMNYNQKNRWRCSFLDDDDDVIVIACMYGLSLQWDMPWNFNSFLSSCYHEIVLHEVIFSVLLAPQCALLNTSNTREEVRCHYEVSQVPVYIHTFFNNNKEIV